MDRYHYIIILIILFFSSACSANETEEPNNNEASSSQEQEPRTVQVSLSDEGDYTSLETAVAEAVPGSTIILDAGQFELSAPLVISKSLTLQGAGADLTTISNSAGGTAVLAIDGEQINVQIQELALQRSGEFAGNIVIAFEGQVDFEDCKISGGAKATDDSVTGDGLLVWGSSDVTVKNCTIEENMGAGIVVLDNAQATIDEVTCSHNERGIAFLEESTGQISNSDCSRNELTGILIAGSAHVDIINNTITGNGSIGILVQLDTDAGGEIRGNSLARNALSVSGTDIQVWEEFTPTIVDNSCDGKGESVLGGDHNGIVFMARRTLPPASAMGSISANSCSKAICKSTSGTLLSLECN